MPNESPSGPLGITHCFEKYMKRILRILLWIVALFVGSTVFAVLVYKWVPVTITPLMVIRSMDKPEGYPEGGWKHRWVPLSEMSEWMPKAVVSSEDQRFYTHHGFDFEQIEAAMREAREGGRQRGASTISQQTAKNVFLWPGHSWVRKGLEAYFTVLIELFWSKERIMEVYLNSIEMGPGIYGVAAASEEYFHRAPSELTKGQCALIAACLPAPLKRDPAHPTSYLNRRKRQIMKYMY